MSEPRPSPRPPWWLLAIGGLAALLAGTSAPDAKPPQSLGPWIGAGINRSGAPTITRLAWRAPAARADLRRGDRILAVDGRPVRDAAEAQRLVRHGRPDRAVTLRIARGTQVKVLRVPRARGPATPGYVRLHLVHAPAPDFTLPRLLGAGRVTLRQLRGRVVFLYSWASWCPSCKPAFAKLTRLHRRFGTRGVTVLGLAHDATATPAQRVARALGVPFDLLHNANGRLTQRYRYRILPSLVIIDRQGVVRTYVQGAGFRYDQLARSARRWLRRTRYPSRPAGDDLWI